MKKKPRICLHPFFSSAYQHQFGLSTYKFDVIFAQWSLFDLECLEIGQFQCFLPFHQSNLNLVFMFDGCFFHVTGQSLRFELISFGIYQLVKIFLSFATKKVATVPINLPQVSWNLTKLCPTNMKIILDNTGVFSWSQKSMIRGSSEHSEPFWDVMLIRHWTWWTFYGFTHIIRNLLQNI